MKSFKSFMTVAALALMAMVASCKSSDPESGTGENNGGIPGGGSGGGATELLTPSSLKGFVHDTDGNPVSGVSVKTGTLSATTDALGGFALDKVKVVDGRTVVRFSKTGYFDVVRSVSNADKDNWEVVIARKGDSRVSDSKTAQNTEVVNLETTAGMKVALPADCYKVDATGEAYKGEVNSSMLYLNPDDKNFSEMMPGGDLAAVRTNEEVVQLVSYGMTQVNLTDDKGNKLQLKDGKEADLTFPIPESLKDKTPSQIPLWSFNEETGLWEEEGVATLQGDVYVGKVKHFSWVNLDWPESRVTVGGRVTIAGTGTPVPHVTVHVGQAVVTTNAQGEYSCFAPANTTFEITILSEDYSYYSPVHNETVTTGNGGTVLTHDIQLPRLSQVTGTVVDVNTKKPVGAIVWLEYNGKSTKSTYTNDNGAFSIPAPAGYTGPATVKIFASDGKTYPQQVTLNGSDIALGTIAVGTASTDPHPSKNGGMLYITANGKVHEIEMTIPELTRENFMNGDGMVYVIDDNVSVATGFGKPENPEEWSEKGWSLQVESYDGQRRAYFNYINMNSNGGERAYLSEGITTRVEKDRLYVDMKGIGMYSFMTGGFSAAGGFEEEMDQQATFLADNLSFAINVKAETRRNIARSQLPGFAPMPKSGVWPIGLFYTIIPSFQAKQLYEVYMDGSLADVLDLIDQVKKAGLKSIDGDIEPVENFSCEMSFYNETTRNGVYIEWEPWNDDIKDDGAVSAENISARITVGIGVDVDKPEDDEISPNYAKIKALRKARK